MTCSTVAQEIWEAGQRPDEVRMHIAVARGVQLSAGVTAFVAVVSAAAALPAQVPTSEIERLLSAAAALQDLCVQPPAPTVSIYFCGLTAIVRFIVGFAFGYRCRD